MQDEKYNELIGITKEIRKSVKQKYLSWYPIFFLLLGSIMIIIFVKFYAKY